MIRPPSLITQPDAGQAIERTVIRCAGSLRSVVAGIERHDATIGFIVARKIFVRAQNLFRLGIEPNVGAALSPRSELRRKFFQRLARNFRFAGALPNVDDSAANQQHDEQNPEPF